MRTDSSSPESHAAVPTRPLAHTLRAATSAAAALLTAGLALTGCAPEPPASSAAPTSPSVSVTPAADVVLFPSDAVPDYQLGGAYPPAPGVTVVARDREAPPADGVYSICYVNAFQTQPGERDAWPDDLLLRGADGDMVIDPDWPDEIIVDTRHPAEVAAVVTPWIAGCADAGFDAVELDNLDTYTRTDDALSRADNLAVAALLVTAAHDNGLAAGQKNAAEDAVLLREDAGFDFAVTEECAAYDECAAYTEVYGDAVIAIEYTDNLPTPFAELCADPTLPHALALRDRDLVTPHDPAYVFETCG